MAFELMDEQEDGIRTVNIKVIGIGGGGCNAVEHMKDFDMMGVERVVANTDMQVLRKSAITQQIQLGKQTTRGLGAGSKPEVGRRAAEEDRDRIQELLTGADMVFLAAGMGGGTGTGATPVFAEIARELGILTVAIVTKPFSWEGAQRMRAAEKGLEELKHVVDCLIIIPNQRLSEVMDGTSSIIDAFKMVNDVLKNGVQSIARVIQEAGAINLDLEDVKTIMSERGIAMMGTGEAQGENRARAATEKAISSPLLENIDISHARGLLVNVVGNDSLSIKEFNEVGQLIHDIIDDEKVACKFGMLMSDDMGDTLRVTVVATGIRDEDEEAPYLDAPGEASDDGYIDNLDIPSILRASKSRR